MVIVLVYSSAAGAGTHPFILLVAGFVSSLRFSNAPPPLLREEPNVTSVFDSAMREESPTLHVQGK